MFPIAAVFLRSTQTQRESLFSLILTFFLTCSQSYNILHGQLTLLFNQCHLVRIVNNLQLDFKERLHLTEEKHLHHLCAYIG